MIQYSWGPRGLETKDVSSFNALFYDPLWVGRPTYASVLVLVEGRDIPGSHRTKDSFIVMRVSRSGRTAMLLGLQRGTQDTTWQTFDHASALVSFLLRIGLNASMIHALRHRLGVDEPTPVIQPAPAPATAAAARPPKKKAPKKIQVLDYSQLDPGIRRTVQILREAGFNTIDSGDGASKLSAQPEALDYPHVFCKASNSKSGPEARRLYRVLGPKLKPEARPSLEVSVAVGSPYIGDNKLQHTAVLCVLGISDADLE